MRRAATMPLGSNHIHRERVVLKFVHLTLHVMRGHGRPKDGVATFAYDPRIHEAARRRKTYVVGTAPWIAGSSPAMTSIRFWRNEPEGLGGRAFWRNEPEISQSKTWMAGTSPAMKNVDSVRVEGALALLRDALGLLQRARLGLAGAADALDRAARLAGFFRDLGVLLGDDRLGRLVAVETAERGGRNAAVRALRAVFVVNVEQHEFADRTG